MSSHAIIVENLRKKYIVREGLRGKKIVEALRGVTFRVRKGTIHALLGPNGAGKTTTLRIISTLLLPDEGRVEVLGHDVVKETEKVRKILGVVLDVSRGFYLLLSGFENLVFYGMLRGMSIKEAKRRARQVLELVGLDESAAARPYHTYSLGMRARLAIAKALMTDPEVLLLDEPTLGLDVESARTVRSLLQALAREGRTILVTGHNMHEIEQIAHEVTIINNGQVVISGSIEQLRNYVGSVCKLCMKLGQANARELLLKLRDRFEIIREEISQADTYISVTMYIRANREDIMSTIFEIVKKTDVKLLDLSLSEPTLEDVYISIVRRT